MLPILAVLLQASTVSPPPLVRSPVVPPPVISPAPTIDTGTPPPRDWFERATPPKPRTPLPGLFTAMDYPVSAIRAAQEGTVAVMLGIDAQGRVTRCLVEESSRVLALDYAACRILRSRARFTPARNANGELVPSAVRTRIAWRLPEDRRIPLSDWNARVTLVLSGNGELKSCAEAIAGIRRVPGPNCQMFGALSGTARLAALAGGGKGNVTVILDTQLSAEGRVPPAPASGTILSRTVASLTANPGGGIAECEFLVRTGTLPANGRSCSETFAGPYERRETPTTVVVSATVVRQP